MKQNGFSLLELLVVMAIIGVIMAIGVVNFASTNQRSREAKRKADVEVIRSALEIYRSENGTYPALTSDGNGCISSTNISAGAATYLSKVPTDPKNDGANGFCYKYTRPTTTTYTLSYYIEVVGSCSGTVNGSVCEYVQP